MARVCSLLARPLLRCFLSLLLALLLAVSMAQDMPTPEPTPAPSKKPTTKRPTSAPTSPGYPAVSSPYSIPLDNLFNNSLVATVVDSQSSVYLLLASGPIYGCAYNGTDCSVAFATTQKSFIKAHGAAFDSLNRLYVLDRYRIWKCTNAAGCLMHYDARTSAVTSSSNLDLYGITFDATYSKIYFGNRDCWGRALGRCGANTYIARCPYTLSTGTIGTCTKYISTPRLGYQCGVNSIHFDYSGLNLLIVCGYYKTIAQCSSTACSNVTQSLLTLSTNKKTKMKYGSLTDVAVDQYFGYIYISDSGSNQVYLCTPDAAVCYVMLDRTYQNSLRGPQNISLQAPFGLMAISEAQRTLFLVDSNPLLWAVQLNGVPSPMPSPRPTIIVSNPGYFGLIGLGVMLISVVAGTVLYSRRPPPTYLMALSSDEDRDL